MYVNISHAWFLNYGLYGHSARMKAKTVVSVAGITFGAAKDWEAGQLHELVGRVCFD